MTQPAPVPSFDLVTSVGKAYQLVWAERQYLLRLALVPFLAKLVLFAIAYSTMSGDTNLWRMSLIMTPAWIVEGWMLAHFVRLILLKQRWPFQPTGDREQDLPVLQTRYRGVMAGAVAFALTQLLVAGWFAVLITFVPVDLDAPASQAELTPQAAVIACLLFGLALYAFRFLWLYVPAAVGADLRFSAIRLAQGLMISFRLLAVWLLCAVPVMVVMQVILGVALMIAGPDNAASVGSVVSVVAKVILDIVKNLLCAAAVAIAFRSIFGAERTA